MLNKKQLEDIKKDKDECGCITCVDVSKALETALAYRQILEQLEWCVIAKQGVDRRCPICMGLKSEGHDSDCELKALLQEGF